MKEYTKTKVCYKTTNKEGEAVNRITSETAWNALVKEATEKQQEAPALVGIQTFGYKAAESVDDAVVLAGGQGVGEFENIEVFLGVYNYGASLRQDNEANDIIQSDTFTASEGAVDVSYAVAQKVERSKMTTEEKALSLLAKGGMKISAEQLRAALALITQQNSQAAGA